MLYTKNINTTNVKGFRKNYETRDTKSYHPFIQSLPNDRGAHSRPVRCQNAGNLGQAMTDELFNSDYLFLKKLLLLIKTSLWIDFPKMWTLKLGSDFVNIKTSNE